MELTSGQLVLYLVILVLVIALIYSTLLHARTNRTNPQGQIDLVGAVTDAFKDFLNSSLILGISRAAAENVPPDVLADLISRTKASQVVVGADSERGQLLKALEEYLETIDSDPTNDPVKIVAGVRQILASQSTPDPKG